MTQPVIADVSKIREILPHRPPFLFVDEVLALTPDKRILAKLALLADAPHFAGHFPGEPIMPGVLIAEALAQTSGLLLALSAMDKGDDARGQMFYLAKANMKWLEPARPGEVLLLEAKLVRLLGELVAFDVRAFTDIKNKDVASGSLVLAKIR